MSGSQTFQRLGGEILEEHRQIHFYLDQVAVSLEGLKPNAENAAKGDSDDVEPMRRLAAQIEGLKERLVEHHEFEENGGLFQVMLETMPECSVEMGRLVRQHARMIEILEMARIHAQCGDASEAEGLRTDLESFLAMFREHERDEEELLRRAIERDGRNAG